MGKKVINNENKVFVSQPFLPPLKEFQEYLKEIWDSKRLTNNGPLHRQLEQALCDYLGINFISLFTNGTLALITALQELKITDEVITTPFSFVATTHALWWNNIKPVFADIEPETFNLDPDKVEAAITPKTTAILPVHVYGNPCNVQRIQQIAEDYGLKVIYDAAHAFGVEIDGIPLVDFGDLSILSFHATKVFHTFEGGAIVCHDKNTKHRIDYLKNFGFVGETNVVAPGINAKMSEIQAAMGLLNLKYSKSINDTRENIAKKYRELLQGIKGIHYLDDLPGIKHSYCYFPILVDKEKYGMSRDELYEKIKSNNIFVRRYFYPLISHFSTYRSLPSANPSNLPVAEKVAEQVICLPFYTDVEKKLIDRVVTLIRG